MKLSIVTTLYHSSSCLHEFYQRIEKQARMISDQYEIIFVNDGSPDDSLYIAQEIFKMDDHVKIIDLSRNFGHHRALMTGLSFSHGDLTFLIDSDLEEEPELLTQFLDVYRKHDCDVVYGVQKNRRGGIFERYSGEFFYQIMNYLSDLEMPHNVLTARLMSRRYVNSLLQYNEQELFLPAIWFITGFTQIPVQVEKHSYGNSTYTLRKKIALAVNSITSFSSKPLVFIFNIGLFITVVSFCYILYLITRRLFFAQAVEGWTSLIVSVWFLGGLTILFVGIIGVYLSKIYIETKRRPFSIIKNIYSREYPEDNLQNRSKDIL